ncbi:cyclic nucleotide-binding domain-containing protein [bacterium]|nr:cyclic nucleotide-binding domain-containing protein [bacterium]
MWKFLKIYEGEGYKVFLFSILGILLDAGFTMGFVGADAMFLTHLGADKLPYVYFVLPFIMMFITPLISYAMDRVGMFSTNCVAFVLLAVGGIGVFFILESSGVFSFPPSWLYFIVKIYTSLWYFVLYSLYWNFVDAYFDILSAKRLFPIFAGIKNIGIVCGSSLVTFFMGLALDVNLLFLLWAVLALLAFIPTILIRRHFSTISSDEEPETVTLGDQISKLKETFLSSRYVICLSFTALFGTYLAYICEYQYMNIFETRFDTEQDLARFFGSFHLFINFFNTLVTLFFLNRIISHLGIRNIALLQPIAYLISFTAYISFHGYSEPMFYAGMFGFFAFNGLHKTIEDNNWNFLLNPIARKNKSSFRTFAEGFIDPFASAFAGLNLILVLNFFQLDFLEISVVMVGTSMLYFCVVLILRHYYVGEMVTNLRGEWLDFSLEEEAIFAGLDRKQLEGLTQLNETNNHQEQLSAIYILWFNDRQKAVHCLLDFIDREALHKIELARPLLARMMESQDTKIIRIILKWMLNHEEDEKTLIFREIGQYNLMQTDRILTLLEDQNPYVRGAASNILWNHWNLSHGYLAMHTLQSLLSGDEASQVAGIRAIGFSNHTHYAAFLVQFLDHPSPEVQEAAKTGICNLVNPQSIHLLEPIITIVRDSDSDLRSRAFRALIQIDDSQCIPPMLSLAEHFSPFERRQVNQVILAMGLRGIPSIVHILKNESYSYPARSIAARALAHLALHQLQSLIPELVARELPRAYKMLYYHQVLASQQSSSSGIFVLSRYYRDEQVTTLEFILELLTLGGQLANHEMIASALQSNNPKIWGNAIETIEQAVDWRLFKIILPLVDNRPIEDKIQFYRKQFDMSPVDMAEVIDRAWQSAMELEKAAAAQAKWDRILENEPSTPALNEEDPWSALMEQLCYDLGKTPSIVKETIFSLMLRQEESSTQDTIIDRIGLLCETNLFDTISLMDMSMIAKGAVPVSCNEGKTIYQNGEKRNSLYVVSKGEVELENGQIARYRRGEAFGIEMFTGQATRAGRAKAKGDVVFYRFEEEFLLQCARIKPRIAIALLQKGLGF